MAELTEKIDIKSMLPEELAEYLRLARTAGVSGKAALSLVFRRLRLVG